MWTRRGLIALGVASLIAGCGQHQSQRAEVATYLAKVDRVEKALAAQLSKVTQAASQFAQAQQTGGSLTSLVYSADAQKLLKAGSQIRLLGRRLAAMRAPRAAAQLRSLLLQIDAGEAQLTHELAQLVTFIPRFIAALHPLSPATIRLQDSLSKGAALSSANAATVYATKAAAVRRFKEVVDAILTQLRQLVPPPVQRPNYTTELASLRGMSATAGQLATSLQENQQADIQPLLLRFERAATLNQTVAAQKAQIAAIRAYDDQSLKLARLSQAAEQERLRLANNLS